MTDPDSDLRAVLLEAHARPSRYGDWDDVMRRTKHRIVPRWLFTRAVPAGACAVGALLLTVLFTRLAAEKPQQTAQDPFRVSLFDRGQSNSEARQGAAQGDDSGILPATVRHLSRRNDLGSATRDFYAGKTANGDFCLIEDIGGNLSSLCRPASSLAVQGVAVTLDSDRPDLVVAHVGLVSDAVTRARVVGGAESAIANNSYVLRGTTYKDEVEVFEPATGWRSVVTPSSVRFSVFEHTAAEPRFAVTQQPWVTKGRLVPTSLRIAGTLSRTVVYSARSESGEFCLVVDLPTGDPTVQCRALEVVGLASGLPISVELPGTNAGYLVAALVPDNVKRATIDGREVPVVDNAVVGRSTRREAIEVLGRSQWIRLTDAPFPRLSILARPRQSQDELPNVFKREQASDFPVDLASTRLAYRRDDVKLWVGRVSDGRLTLAYATPFAQGSTFESDSADLRRRGWLDAGIGLASGEGSYAAGIVPDGVSAVRLGALSAPAENNVFFLEVPASQKGTLEFLTEDGWVPAR